MDIQNIDMQGMETTVIQMPCEIDREYLCKRLRLKANAPYMKRVDQWIKEALEIGRPKMAYRLAYIDAKGDDFVVIENVKFTSRVLRVNLEKVNKVVVYVVTSGTELEEWSKDFSDSFEILCVDGIKEEALRCAMKKIFPQIEEKFDFQKSADMQPGSLPEWPLQEQQPLFKLLGDVKELVGVELSESYVMSPIKSESGFHFPSESNYTNCQICLHETCPDRRAPFDKNLYENKYRLNK